MYDADDHYAPLVSVVMPVYNAARFLAESIGSVQAQSSADWELVAVDDGSSDNSPGLLVGLAAADPRIRPQFLAQNRGAAAARNIGMDAARGRFVAFLDADDLWQPEKLAWHLNWLGRHPTGLSFTAYSRFNLESGSVETVGVPECVNRRQLLGTNVIGCSTVILDRQILGECRMPDLRLRQDFAFWLDILQRQPVARGLPIMLTKYRCHATQVSGDKGRAAQATWQMYRQHLGLSWAQASHHFLKYAACGVLRHRLPALARQLGCLSTPVGTESPEVQRFLGP